MIRFCDKNIDYIEYDCLDRDILMDYFCSTDRNDFVCIYENKFSMRYIGKITYDMLIQNENIHDAIDKRYVILDSNIWDNGRNYFKLNKKNIEDHLLLPVLNKEHKLICFAFEDFDANKELRMLRELKETIGAIQFSDIYYEFNCVRIYGFNELAYFFAMYLKKLNIVVKVFGDMWKGFFKSSNQEVLDCKSLTIYAEGLNQKKKYWKENLIKSVSVEFECIDQVYIANLQGGIIKDVYEDSESLFKRLKNEKEIVLIGSKLDAQDAYDLLIGKGIEISYFMDNRCEFSEYKLFGKRIIKDAEVWKLCKNPVFIDTAHSKSSWGLGNIDYYDYYGYKRNEKFYLLRDYIEVEKNNLLNIIHNTKIILAGDIYLCKKLSNYFQQEKISVLGYLDILFQNADLDLTEISAEYINKDVLILFAIPEICVVDNSKKDIMLSFVKQNNIDNYSDYFSYTISFINIEMYIKNKYRKNLIPKEIVIGLIGGFSGNSFFRGLLDNHPNIMMITDYCYINSSLFWICVRLSVEKSENILDLFWKLYTSEGWGFIDNPLLFNKKMSELMCFGDRFTSQELFVMIHIAYMNMWKEVGNDVKNMVIYWEPHEMLRIVGEEWVKWLSAENVTCGIINITRNMYIRNGSSIRGLLEIVKEGMENEAYKIYVRALANPPIDKRVFGINDRLIVKFEDLKCKSRETLLKICDRWHIMWNETLLRTTYRGGENYYNNGEYLVKDFDLRPVYNLYEQYFSEYDRFRITLFNAPFQKKYDYSLINLAQFTRKELQDMFVKSFYFEKLIVFENYIEELEFRIKLQKILRSELYKRRMMDIFQILYIEDYILDEFDELRDFKESIRVVNNI